MPLQRRNPTVDPVSTTDNYAALCAVLWSERSLLESLACTVVVSQLIPRHSSLAAVSAPAASPALVEVTERLQLQEVLRAAVAEAVAETAGLPAPATLAELAIDAPEPWATMLLDHRAALSALMSDVADLGAAEQRSLADFLA